MNPRMSLLLSALVPMTVEAQTLPQCSHVDATDYPSTYYSCQLGGVTFTTASTATPGLFYANGFGAPQGSSALSYAAAFDMDWAWHGNQITVTYTPHPTIYLSGSSKIAIPSGASAFAAIESQQDSWAEWGTDTFFGLGAATQSAGFITNVSAYYDNLDPTVSINPNGTTQDLGSTALWAMDLYSGSEYAAASQRREVGFDAAGITNYGAFSASASATPGSIGLTSPGSAIYTDMEVAARITLMNDLLDPSIPGSGSPTMSAFVSGSWAVTYTTVTPEPSTWFMLLTGLVTLAIIQCKRNG